MLALSFGTDAEREHALHGIRTIHTRVNGHLPRAVGLFPAGAAYSAEDPALVLWVHLTLLESIPLAYQRFVGPVADDERDTYCAETAWVPIALGARPADVPVTWTHASEQLSRMYGSGILSVGDQEVSCLFRSAPRATSSFSRRVVNESSRLVCCGHDKELYGWPGARRFSAGRSHVVLSRAQSTIPALWRYGRKPALATRASGRTNVHRQSRPSIDRTSPLVVAEG